MEGVWQELRLMEGLLVAFVLSGVIGWERERSGHSAGLRTHMMVGMSAALFVVLADTLISNFGGRDAGVRFDMIGILGAVVSGISFLGAGVIFSAGRGEKARGLTTAAGLLATAGVGLACGLHLYVLATGATLLFVFTLAVIQRWLEHKGHAEREG
ncbi:MgtC/SapB family protein [Deinococcus aerophilus]|nr:MgtC/SapB family protein [Deinococcus aerophilus]